MYCLTIEYIPVNSSSGFFKIWKKKNKHHEKFYRHRKKMEEPCAIFENGDVDYWYSGFKYNLDKTENSTEITMNVNREKLLHSLDDYPSVIYSNGTKEWHCLGELHRRGFPAVEYANGDKEYWFYGKRHREKGPAVIFGNKQYWFEAGEFQKCM